MKNSSDWSLAGMICFGMLACGVVGYQIGQQPPVESPKTIVVSPAPSTDERIVDMRHELAVCAARAEQLKRRALNAEYLLQERFAEWEADLQAQYDGD